MIMNRIKLIFEQTMMVSFMILCYIGIYGLLALRKYDYQFEWYIPGSIVVAGFLCSLLTVFLLYGAAESKDESPLKYNITKILHFILLYGVIMGFGFLCHWYDELSGFILTSVIYVIIYVGAWVGTLLLFRRDEKLISDALDKIRDEE